MELSIVTAVLGSAGALLGGVSLLVARVVFAQQRLIEATLAQLAATQERQQVRIRELEATVDRLRMEIAGIGPYWRPHGDQVKH